MLRTVLTILSKHLFIAAVTDFTVTMERSEVITFSEPITQIYHGLFVRNPSERPNYSAYTEPLHWHVWAVISLFVLAAPLVLCGTTT